MDVEATPARMSQEIVAAKKLLARTADRHAFRPDALTANKSYGTGPFLAWLLKLPFWLAVQFLSLHHVANGQFYLALHLR
jgi:hypothetical protein